MPEDTGTGRVTITNREIYDMLTQVRDRVFAVEKNLEITLKDNSDLNKRVRALELRFYGILAGVIGAIVILVRSVV